MMRSVQRACAQRTRGLLQQRRSCSTGIEMRRNWTDIEVRHEIDFWPDLSKLTFKEKMFVGSWASCSQRSALVHDHGYLLMHCRTPPDEFDEHNSQCIHFVYVDEPRRRKMFASRLVMELHHHDVVVFPIDDVAIALFEKVGYVAGTEAEGWYREADRGGGEAPSTLELSRVAVPPSIRQLGPGHGPISNAAGRRKHGTRS